ncbi:response regulator [Rhabdochromatium marinum]|uniref:response regulator n=1 Tax=Rhabdochromatium marinum TaxID=48729 RepID=UPI0019088781|nr:response regulator [Rhabdochromatium marinum]MBK1649191.1 response regulator receiver protein [Rhabdochromatium marinum]
MRPFLVVDDDDIALGLIETLLNREGWSAETASDGLEAWEQLDAEPQRYELVILDRIMPRMDGIEVLRRINADHRFDDLPVIMQTSAVSPSEVEQGLVAGAWHYLAKPYEEASLHHLIRIALQDRQTRLELRRMRVERESVWGMLREARFEFRRFDEAERLAALLAIPAQKPGKVSLGLLELMLNAVEHGNLELGYTGKTAALASEDWHKELERRLSDPLYCDRVAEVRVRIEGEQLIYRIKDQGAGFDWARYLDIDPKRMFDSHGRGIAMTRQLAFERLEYLGAGNEVEAITSSACMNGNLDAIDSGPG